MGYNHRMIILSLIIIAIALGYGYFVSLSYTETPTLGDVIRGTLFSPALVVVPILAFLWWVAG